MQDPLEAAWQRATKGATATADPLEAAWARATAKTPTAPADTSARDDFFAGTRPAEDPADNTPGLNLRGSRAPKAAPPDPGYMAKLSENASAPGWKVGLETAIGAGNSPLELAKQGVEGAGILIRQAAGGLPYGINPLQNAADAIPTIPDVEGTDKSGALQTARQVGSGAGFVAMGALAPGALGLTGWGAFVPGAVMAATSQGVDNYKRVLGTTGDGDKAMIAMLEGAGAGAALSVLPVSRVLARINGASGGALMRAIADVGVFGGTAASQTALNDVIIQHATGEDLPILKDAIESGTVGALTGLLTAGVGAAFAKRAPKTDVAREKPVTDEFHLNPEPAPIEQHAAPQEQPATATKADAAPPGGGGVVDEAAPERTALESNASAEAKPLEGPTHEGLFSIPTSEAEAATRARHEDLIKSRTPDELESLIEQRKQEEREHEDVILKDRADEWRRASNRGNTKKTDAIEAELGLSQAQIDSLYGIGDPRASAERLNDILKEVRSVEGAADDPAQLAQEAAWAMRKMGATGDTAEEWSSREPEKFAALQRIAEIVGEKGYDPVEFSREAIKKAASAFHDPEDAAAVLEPFLKNMQRPPPRMELPAAMPKGKHLGTDLTGEPVYSKQERGDIGRTGEGVKAPAASQVGMFDEHGGLFEEQATERDQGKRALPIKKTITVDEARATLDKHGSLSASFLARTHNLGHGEATRLVEAIRTEDASKAEIPVAKAVEPEKPPIPVERVAEEPKRTIPLRKNGKPKEVTPLDVDMIREHLAHLAENETGQAERGGNLIFGQEGDANREVVGRTKWLSKAEVMSGENWWNERPGGSKTGLKPTEAQSAVRKALAGEDLTPRQKETVDYMIDVATRRMTSGYDATVEDLHAAQQERKAIQGESKSINRKVEVAPGVLFAKAPGLLGKVLDLLTKPFDVKPGESAPGALRTPDQIDQANDILDRHLGERQVRETEVAIRSRKHLEEIKDVTPGGLSERVKTRAAMQLYIDSKDGGGVEAAAAAHPKWDPNAEAGGLAAGVKATKGEIVQRAIDLTPQQKALADKIAAESHAEGETFAKEGLIGAAHENYATRIWAPDEEGAQPKSGKVGKLATSAMQQKGRSLDSIFHGWEIGKELQTFDAAKAQHIASRNLYQVRADKALLAEGVKAGVLSTTKEPGYVEIQHPNAQKYVVAGAAKGDAQLEVWNRNLHATDDGTILLRQPLYAPESVARKLNAIVGHSRISDVGGKPGAALKAYDKWNRIFKEQILSFSGFHAITFIRAHTLGTSLEGLNPIKAWTEGKRLQDEFGPTAQRAVRAGLRLQGAPDFDEFASHEKTRVGKLIEALPVAREVKAAMTKTAHAITDFTFQQLGPRLKMWNYVISEQANLRKGMSADEAAKASATLTNDRFGGLNLERLERDRTMQHAAHMLALAPDWTESNLRQVAKAFQSGDAQGGYRRMWVNVLTRGALMTVVGNYVLSGFDNKKFRDNYHKAWDTGSLRWLDVDITPIYRAAGGTSPDEKYLSTLGHFTISLRAVQNPLKFLKDRGSVISSTVLAALQGTDFAQRPFTSFDELTGQDPRGKLGGETVSHSSSEEAGPIKYEQMPSFVLNRAKGMAPIPFQNAASFLMGETDAFDALVRNVGLPEASTPPSSLFKKYRDQIDREYQSAQNGKSFDAEMAGWRKSASKAASDAAKLRAAGDEKGAQRLLDEFNTAFRTRD